MTPDLWWLLAWGLVAFAFGLFAAEILREHD